MSEDGANLVCERLVDDDEIGGEAVEDSACGKRPLVLKEGLGNEEGRTSGSRVVVPERSVRHSGERTSEEESRRAERSSVPSEDTENDDGDVRETCIRRFVSE